MTKDIDFDPLSKEVLDKGPDAYIELGRRCPMHHYKGDFEFHIVSDPEDITNSMLKDNDSWSVEEGIGPTPQRSDLRLGVTTDPPHHLKVRQVMQRGFTPPQLKRLAVEIDRIADELLDVMDNMPEKKGDFYDLFAAPLPARIMCIMLGVPEKDYVFYKEWADNFLLNDMNNPNFDNKVEEAGRISAPIIGIINERRALLESKGLKPDLSLLGNEIPDDFISRFMCDQIDGEPLSVQEIISLLLATIIGGNETTMNLIGSLLWSLLEKPERWEAVKADPSLIDVAIEESLRIDPPVLGLLRTAKKDVDLNAGHVPKGRRVMYNISAANRNPDIWENPDEFRLDRPLREARRHCSFSGGAHTCIGAPLARMEVKQIFEKLIVRLPNLAIAGERERIGPYSFWGSKALPVTW